MKALQQLQDMGLVTQTMQFSGSVGWGYKIFKPALKEFSSSIWSEKEIIANQKSLFPWIFEPTTIDA